MKPLYSKTRSSLHPAFLGAASVAMALAPAPALAGADITNFTVENCANERIFVCSFDKTDSLMKVPYKAKGVQPNDKKEFGCASLNKCKVIIGVSEKHSNRTLGNHPQIAITAMGTAVGVGVGVGLAFFSTVGAPVAIAAGAIIAVGAGASVAALEIKDGWKDGDVCNEVRKASQKAGFKPKHFLKDGEKYQVIERYAVDKNGNPFTYDDGTAVIAYTTQTGKGKCPAPLDPSITLPPVAK